MRRSFVLLVGVVAVATMVAGCASPGEEPASGDEAGDASDPAGPGVTVDRGSHDGWPMLGQDGANTGHAEDETGPGEAADELWSLDDRTGSSTMAIADGTLFANGLALE
jgi:hypothetical protein